MKKQTTVLFILAVTLISCFVMELVDGIIHPGYAIKSGIKLVMFGLLPLLCAVVDPQIQLRPALQFRRKGFFSALALGIGVYAVIVSGYYFLSKILDFSGIVDTLSSNAGVEKDNFLLVSAYIILVNSLLEEFFFRGFLFLNLKRLWGKWAAHSISALAFAVYHVAMMIGWFDLWLFLVILLGLALGGVMFNLLDQKSETIYPSWLTHMFANFAINTIGFLLMA